LEMTSIFLSLKNCSLPRIHCSVTSQLNGVWLLQMESFNLRKLKNCWFSAVWKYQVKDVIPVRVGNMKYLYITGNFKKRRNSLNILGLFPPQKPSRSDDRSWYVLGSQWDRRSSSRRAINLDATDRRWRATSPGVWGGPPSGRKSP